MDAPQVTRYTSIRYSSCYHTRVSVCGNNLNIVLEYRIPLVVKENFFIFPVAVNNSIKVGPLVFLL
jgi:hypothetical protein